MYTKEELEEMNTSAIRKMATKEYEVTGASKFKKAELIELILRKQSQIDLEDFRKQMMEQADEEIYEPDSYFEEESEGKEDEMEIYEFEEFDEYEPSKETDDSEDDEEKELYEVPKFVEAKPEQLSLDIDQSDSVKADSTQIKTESQQKALTQEELNKQRKESVAIARGQQLTTTVNGKKVTIGANKLLGLLLLIDVHLIIDNLIIIVESLMYFLWYGEKVSVKTEEGYLLLCLAFPLFLILFKKMNSALNGITAIVKSFQKEEDKKTK